MEVYFVQLFLIFAAFVSRGLGAPERIPIGECCTNSPRYTLNVILSDCTNSGVNNFCSITMPIIKVTTMTLIIGSVVTLIMGSQNCSGAFVGVL